MNDLISRYMLFSVGEQRYAIDVEAVDEISELLPEHPIPDAPRFLRGVINIHGKFAAVLDLSMYLGAGPAPNIRNLLLLKIPDTGLAIAVTQMERIIPAEEIVSREPGKAEFEQAILNLKDGKAAVLELHSLVDSLEKAIAA